MESFLEQTNQKEINPKNTLEAFYFLLWKTEESERTKLKLNIPNTIIFKFGILNSWYFTSKQDGSIKKKIRKSTIIDDLIKYFESRKKNSILGIAAVIYTFLSGENIEVEYLKFEEIEDFVRQRKKKYKEIMFRNCVIMQEFVESEGLFTSKIFLIFRDD